MDYIRVILADDHNILRYGLQLFLSRTNDIEIVGEAASGEECIRLYKETAPDVCILDIEMPNKNGIEVVRTIREMDKNARFLILSMHSDLGTFNEAMEAGIDGYLLKDTSKKKIVRAIRRIAAGERVFAETIAELKSTAGSDNFDAAAEITDREKEILQFVAAGYSSPQIAKKLYISPRTVDTHRNNIMQKLNIHNTASLVRFALRHNLVDTSLNESNS